MNPVYVVLVINLIIWSGIFGYIVHLNNEVKRLKTELKKLENQT